MRAREEAFHIEEVPIVFIDRFYGESILGATRFYVSEKPATVINEC